MSVIRCRSRWRLAWLAGVLVLTVPLAAACGASSSTGPAASPGNQLYEQAVVYSQCMRSHDVTDFPIPAKGPGGTLVHPVRPLSGMLSSAHYDPAFCACLKQAVISGGRQYAARYRAIAARRITAPSAWTRTR